MKSSLLVSALLLLFCSSAFAINEGDNLKVEYSKVKKHYFFKAPELSAWKEAAGMLLIGDKPNQTSCSYLFIALKDTSLLGVYKPGKIDTFLFDTEGNSILDNTSEIFYLPEWTVKRHAKIDAGNTDFLDLINVFYEKTLQEDDGRLDDKTIEKYLDYKTNTSLANRHLMVLFDDHQLIVSATGAKNKRVPPASSLLIMKALAGECDTLYHKIPAILYIYLGEDYQNAGDLDNAKKMFQTGLQLYPDSVPLLVYDCRLEMNAPQRTTKKIKLKTMYPNHWMVKGI